MFKSIVILACVVAASNAGVLSTVNNIPNAPVVPRPVVTTSTIALPVNSALSNTGNTLTNGMLKNHCHFEDVKGNNTF